MAPEPLANLARIGQLKVEARNPAEVARMLKLAKTRLANAKLPHVSRDGRFANGDSAVHAAALAALRWHGHRRAISNLKCNTRLRVRRISSEVQSQILQSKHLTRGGFSASGMRPEAVDYKSAFLKQ
jgi:hypothetical protein